MGVLTGVLTGVLIAALLESRFRQPLAGQSRCLALVTRLTTRQPRHHRRERSRKRVVVGAQPITRGDRRRSVARGCPGCPIGPTELVSGIHCYSPCGRGGGEDQVTLVLRR